MEKKDVYDLTNPQKNIWNTEQYYKGTTINNIVGHLYVDQPINFDLLKKAINQFIKDNDGFRLKLTFDNKSNEVKQYVEEFKNISIEIVTINDKNEIDRLEQSMCNEPFDLMNEFLFRFKIYRLPTGKGGFVIVAHHLIYDAYTASLVANKVMSIYSSFIKKDTISELPTSYIDYINSENKYITSSKYVKDKAYWDDVFKTLPIPGTITGTNHSTQSSPKAKRKTYIFSEAQNKNIKEFCLAHKISSFNFFMGLFALYINKISNTDDFVIGTPILNRSNFAEKNTPGMFISTIPFRIQVDRSLTFGEFIKKIASDSFTMYRHQKYPYQKMLETIRKVNPNQPNLYDILISFQNAKTTSKLSDIPFEIKWSFNGNIADNLQIHLSDLNDEGTLNISYDYRLDKYNDDDICYIHERILYMMDQILHSDNISIKSIDILTSKEKNLILNDFNNTFEDFSYKDNIVEHIEEVAKNNPDVIAIEANDYSITYSQLITRINKLSNYLIKNDFSEGLNIGIYTTRTIDTIIGILAILKINCTYVPIDTQYPADRIKHMVQISKLEYILADNINSFTSRKRYREFRKSINKL